MFLLFIYYYRIKETYITAEYRVSIYINEKAGNRTKHKLSNIHNTSAFRYNINRQILTAT